MNEQTLPPTLSISDVQTSNTTNRISTYKLHTNWYNKYLWHEHQRHLWGLYLNATLILRQKDRKIIREGVFWDFVPNVGPHPPTAHVWDSTKWKVEVRFILLFGLFRAFCFFFWKSERFFRQNSMYLFGTLDPHPTTATPILGQSPKICGFAVRMTEWLFSLKSLGLWTPTCP